jgi:CRISPR system Cascade subunit CasA
VESLTFFNNEEVFKEGWYTALKQEMAELDQLARIVYGATLGYFKNQKVDGKSQAAAASNLFWQLCERKYQALVLECKSEEKTKLLRKEFAQFANTAYNAYCPNNTARQLTAWAAHFPNFSKYLKDVKQPEIEA